MFKFTFFTLNCADLAVVVFFNFIAFTILISLTRLMFTLLHTSMNLTIKRHQLFEMTKSVNLTAKELTVYWDFIDNMWIQNKSFKWIDISKLRFSIFWCWFWWSKAWKDSDNDHRLKRIRDVSLCIMKIKMIKWFLLDDQQLLKLHCVQLRLHIDTCHDLCFEHNHTQNYIDMIKLSLMIKMTVDMKMTRDY